MPRATSGPAKKETVPPPARGTGGAQPAKALTARSGRRWILAIRVRLAGLRLRGLSAVGCLPATFFRGRARRAPMRAVLAAASLLLLSGVLLGVGQARPTGPCDGFEDVPGQGPSRRAAGGLWEVCLQDGSTVLTHGGDPHGLDRAHAPDGPLHAAGEDAAASGPVEGTDGEAGAAGAAAAPSGGSSGYAAPRAPPCAADPLLQHHMVAVYAYASNRQDRYNSKADTVRGYVHQANGHMHAEAQQHGFGVEYRFLCDAGGQVAVLRLALSTPSSQVTFSSVMSDAIAAGMRDPRAQYWIWYDGSDPNYCGIGQFNGDMSLYTGNANN
ncbi:MAG TPA: hypothetical protein VFH47_01000, partial [Candidatus Thermoplasmatota archaeon]|nr:hypothetical protein [Candidatus Thermoplasmatota archaeon]